MTDGVLEKLCAVCSDKPLAVSCLLHRGMEQVFDYVGPWTAVDALRPLAFIDAKKAATFAHAMHDMMTVKRVLEAFEPVPRARFEYLDMLKEPIPEPYSEMYLHGLCAYTCEQRVLQYLCSGLVHDMSAACRLLHASFPGFVCANAHAMEAVGDVMGALKLLLQVCFVCAFGFFLIIVSTVFLFCFVFFPA